MFYLHAQAPLSEIEESVHIVGHLDTPTLDYELDTELVNRFNKQTGLLIIGVTYIPVLASTERCNNFSCRTCYVSGDITRIKHEQGKDCLLYDCCLLFYLTVKISRLLFIYCRKHCLYFYFNCQHLT
jgi:hypothetical protein